MRERNAGLNDRILPRNAAAGERKHGKDRVDPRDLATVLALLSPLMKEGMRAAYNAKLHGDGWVERGACAPWRRGPAAIYALRRKGLLLIEQPSGREPRIKLTELGRQLVEKFPWEFGYSAKGAGK